MSSHQSFPDPPTGDLRHATSMHHSYYQEKREKQGPRSTFLDKADSLLLARSKAAIFSTPSATTTAPPATSARPAHIYGQHPRRSRPSPAFAPRHPFSPSHNFASVSPVIRQVSNHSESSISSESNSSHTPSLSDSSPLPFVPPRSRLRPHSTSQPTSGLPVEDLNPLVSYPPPAPPKPAHYSLRYSQRPLPLAHPLPTRTTSPPPYSSRFASLVRTLSPQLPPLPLKTAATGSPRALPLFNNSNKTHSSSAAKMVSCGRVVCVALPFVLAVLSIVALLVATLAGVADKNLYMFQVNTTGLSISVSDAVDVLSSRAVLVDARSVGFHDPALLSVKDTSDSSTNITAADLSIGKLYDISLWNYCVTEQNGTRDCTKPKFDWATKALNNSENSITSLISSTGANLTIPKELRTAISAFSQLAKWTEVVFIIAFVALALEIIFGLFTSCSRGISCLTFVIAGITVVAVVGAAALATVTSVIVVAAIKTTAEKYGVHGSVNTSYLVAVWISAAAAIAASFFWMFTVCCCSPERRVRSGPGPRHVDDKDVPAGSYQPLHDPRQNAGIYNNANAYAPQYGAPRYPQGGRTDLAYEPYSHSR